MYYICRFYVWIWWITSRKMEILCEVNLRKNQETYRKICLLHTYTLGITNIDVKNPYQPKKTLNQRNKKVVRRFCKSTNIMSWSLANKCCDLKQEHSTCKLFPRKLAKGWFNQTIDGGLARIDFFFKWSCSQQTNMQLNNEACWTLGSRIQFKNGQFQFDSKKTSKIRKNARLAYKRCDLIPLGNVSGITPVDLWTSTTIKTRWCHKYLWSHHWACCFLVLLVFSSIF